MTPFRTFALCALFAVSGGPLPGQEDPCKGCENLTPTNPWDELMRGNGRFTGRFSPVPRMDACRRTCTTDSSRHRPYAVILSCADARVPPEIAFDARIGDLFVV